MKRKFLIIICLFILFIGTGLGVIRLITNSQREATQREEMMEQRIAYAQVNYAFRLPEDLIRVNTEVCIERYGMFIPLPEVDPEVNRFGIITGIYVSLLMYEISTGNVLPYEIVLDYFSQEYESDGSLRLHNNGKHPEIHDYVEWMWERSRWWMEFGRFFSDVNAMKFNYYLNNPDSEFGNPPIHSLSPEMLRVLAFTYSDPEWCATEMNLTEMYRAGY